MRCPELLLTCNSVCVCVDFSALLLNFLALPFFLCSTMCAHHSFLKLDKGQCVCQALILPPVICGGIFRQSCPRLPTACYLLTPVLDERPGENHSYTLSEPSPATELALVPVFNCFLLVCSGLLFSVALPLWSCDPADSQSSCLPFCGHQMKASIV